MAAGPASRFRVGLDAWLGSTHGPGAGRYVRELVRALVQLPEAPRLRLLDVGPGRRAFARGLGLELARQRPRLLRLRAPRALLRPLARAGLDAAALVGGCDLFHRARAFDPPVRAAVPQVLALAELPGEDSDAEARLLAALRGIGDLVVFSAEGARRAVLQLGRDPRRVHQLPVGCDHWLRDLPADVQPEDPPYVLALGRLDRRRHVQELVEACALLRRRGLPVRLVLAGRAGDAASAAAQAPDHVAWLADPGEARLPLLVARASVLAHLSDGELTPVTPLEALACGTAVVASRLPALEEALGDHAQLLEHGAGTPVAVEPLAALLAQALLRRDDAQARAARRLHAAGFTWERHARLTVALWQRILSAEARAR